MALLCGMEYTKPLGGMLIYSGYYMDFIKPTSENNETPIFIYHGMADPMVSWQEA